MSKESALDFANEAASDIQKVRDALDDVDQTAFDEVPRLLDRMTKDCDYALKSIASAVAAIDQIEEPS